MKLLGRATFSTYRSCPNPKPLECRTTTPSKTIWTDFASARTWGTERWVLEVPHWPGIIADERSAFAPNVSFLYGRGNELRPASRDIGVMRTSFTEERVNEFETGGVLV